MATATADSQRWLFGAAPDLLLGCGLGYLLLLLGFAASGADHASITALGVIPLISIFTGTPHYGATLMRVYEHRADRRAYAFFALWLTLVIWFLFYASLYDERLGSVILTLYLTWSPWHYTGQNYGIAVMFLRRRGVKLEARAKGVLYASFILSYLMTLLALHGSAGGGEYAPVPSYQGGVFHLMRLGLPSPYWEWAFALVGVLYLASLFVAARLLLRGGSPRDLLPVAVLALTQMTWFVFPTAARHFGLMGAGAALDGTRTAYAFFWIATGHMVQYLWITTYYAAGRGSGASRLVFLAKTLAAGSFIWGVPGLLYAISFEGSRFGGVARGQDVFVMLAAAVNLHHFVLDGAIWKLRDGRVARILIRSQSRSEGSDPIEPESRRRWFAFAVYAIGGLATLQVLGSWAERELVFEPALRSGNMVHSARSLARLERIRADSATDQMKLGMLAARQKNAQLAKHLYERSLEKQPSLAAWRALGQLEDLGGNLAEAVIAYERALELNPDHAQVLYDLGTVWLLRGEPGRALGYLERGASLLPNDALMRSALARARKQSVEAPIP